MEHVSLHFEKLFGRVLPTAGSKQLANAWHLIGLLKFGSYQQSSDANQLQLSQMHCFAAKITVDISNHRENSLGEHFVF